MPMTPGCQPSAAANTRAGDCGAGLDCRDRRLQRLRLDLAALVVVGVEARCELRGFLRIVGGEQPGAEIGGADPAAGIDPRPQNETEMVGVDRHGHAADRRQRAQPGIAPLPRDPDALRDKRAVDPGQRDDVADGAERDQVEPLQQVGFGPRAVPAGLAQRPVDRDDEQKGDADRGERAVRARLVEPVRIDHRDGRRQQRLADVMIDDDHVEPGFAWRRPAARAPSRRNRP